MEGLHLHHRHHLLLQRGVTVNQRRKLVLRLGSAQRGVTQDISLGKNSCLKAPRFAGWLLTQLSAQIKENVQKLVMNVLYQIFEATSPSKQ